MFSSSTRELADFRLLFRRLLLIGLDALSLISSYWLSFWFYIAHPFASASVVSSPWFSFTALFIGLSLYIFTGQYTGLTRYVGSASFYRLALRNGFLVFLLIAITLIFRLSLPPFSSWFLFWLFLTSFTGAMRFVIRDLLLISKHYQQQLNVAIYGYSEAGAQLAAALRLAGNHNCHFP